MTGRSRATALVLVVVLLGLCNSAGAIAIGSAEITGTVDDLGGGVYQYNYTVVYLFSDTIVVPALAGDVGPALQPIPGPIVDSFLIPFFDLETVAVIPGSIQAPPGWSAEFLATAGSIWDYDPLADPDADTYGAPAEVYIDPPYVLQYSADLLPAGPIVPGPGPELSGFSFQSLYSDTNGPVVIGFTEGEFGQVTAIIDPPHVASPSFPGFAEAVIPEPATLSLLGLGLLAVARRRRR
jgi:hypothetical protein